MDRDGASPDVDAGGYGEPVSRDPVGIPGGVSDLRRSLRCEYYSADFLCLAISMLWLAWEAAIMPRFPACS